MNVICCYLPAAILDEEPTPVQYRH
jgi:hypothetical protein